ncbi:MAG TPA: TonB-dependent receptor, partial [Rhodothermales bacterium]
MQLLHIVAGILVSAGLFTPPSAAHPPIDGRVVDAETREPLVGVHVIAEGTTLGTTTDVDGYFHLDLEQAPENLVFSFLGYETTTISLATAEQPLVVRMKQRMIDLQPLVVSASRVEERRTETPVAIAALSATEIEAKRPDRLVEVMNVLPGVHMTDLGNEQHVMSIRQPLSYGALYVYLEDGIPIRPTGIFNHNALTEINMSGVSRVEVIRGPSSSLFGSNAVGGAVNFITPRPSTHTMGALQVRTDNYGYRRGDFHASSTIGRVGVWAGGYVARQRDGWAEHSDFDKVSLSFRGDYAFTPTTRLYATFSTNQLNTDTNGNLDSLNFYRQGFSSLHTFTHRNVSASRLTAHLDHVWSSRQSTQVSAFWRGNSVGQLPHYRIRNDRNDPTRASGELNEDAFRSLGLNVQHRVYFDFLSTRLIAGGTIDRSPNSFEANFLEVVRDAETGRYVDYVRRDSLLTDFDVQLRNEAAYAQLEFEPMARLKVVTSARYDRVRYGFDNHLAPSAYSGAPDATDTFRRISPRAGVTFDLGSDRGLYANVSRGFVPPEVSELYRGVSVPSLRPSTFDSYEAGGWASFVDGRLYVEASLYRMNGTNEIIDVLLDDGSTENRNAGRTRHTGFEYLITA